MIAVASLIVLIAVIAFSAVTKKNAGVVGLVAAYIFSLAAAKCGTEINVSKVVTGNWPTSVFFIVLATTFLFGIATLNGAGTFQEHRMSRKRKREDPAGDLLSLRYDHLCSRRRRTDRRSHHADCPVRRS